MSWFNPTTWHHHHHASPVPSPSQPSIESDAPLSDQQQRVDDMAAGIDSQMRMTASLPRPENLPGAIRQAQLNLNIDGGAETTAASALAQVQLISEQMGAEPGMNSRDTARAMLAQNLVNLQAGTLSEQDKASAVDLILGSRYTRGLGRGESTLGQILQAVDEDETLGANRKAFLEQQIAHSGYASSLGAGVERLLDDYPRLLNDLKTRPDDLKAISAATFAFYDINYGDGIKALHGTELDNAIGREMGLAIDVKPDAGPSGLSPAKALYSGDRLKQVRAIADLMEKAGPGATLTMEAAVFDPHDGKAGIGKTKFWRLDNADGKTEYINQTGTGNALRTRIYHSVDDFAGHNKAMGDGRMMTVLDGAATVNDDGQILTEHHDRRKGILDQVKHYGAYAIEGAALAGGALLVASGIGTPIGGLLITGAYAAMVTGGAVMAGHGVNSLRDRSAHGEYLAMGRQTAMDYAGIAGGVALPLGKALELGQGAATVAGMGKLSTTAKVGLAGTHGANGAAALYSSGQFAGNWNQLSMQDKLTGGFNMAVLAAGVGQDMHSVHAARTQLASSDAFRTSPSDLYGDMDLALPKIVEQARIEIPHAKNADYIPALAEVNPDQMGIAVRLPDGRLYTAGDAEVPASIQSVSKAFAALLLGDRIGDRAMWNRIGAEPSGRPFNSRELLDMEHGIPHNPAVNAGALVVADALYGVWGRNYPAVLRDMLGKLSGNSKLAINKEVANSEYADAGNNRFLLTMMKEKGNIQNPVEDVLEAYCNQCAIEISAADLSKAAGIFANHGRDPVSGRQLVSPKLVGDLNAAMMMAGAYDEAGRFANQVGMPVKTGVGGLITGWVPSGTHEGLSAATFSPPLNPAGNSAAGLAAFTELSERYDLSLFKQSGDAGGTGLFAN